MTVERIATEDVVSVDNFTGLVETMQIMRNQHVGAVVVTDTVDGRTRPVGMLTDRDLVVSVFALGLDPGALTAGSVMSPTLFKVAAGEDALEAIERMRRLGVRRAPVVNADGTLAGIFTVDDYLAHLAHALRQVSLLIDREQELEAEHRLAVTASAGQ